MYVSTLLNTGGCLVTYHIRNIIVRNIYYTEIKSSQPRSQPFHFRLKTRIEAKHEDSPTFSSKNIDRIKNQQ